MPRNQGTSRKGKPNKYDRASGMGKSLMKLHNHKYHPRSDGKNKSGDGGMQMQTGVESINVVNDDNKTKSILELQDLDDFLIQAEMAQKEFAVEHEGFLVLDATSQAYYSNNNTTNDNTNKGVKWADEQQQQQQQQSKIDNFTFKELSVPRRPKWDSTTTPEELERNEQISFLEWRRSIAQQEEKLGGSTNNGSIIHATPFEKNIEIWRQLWRVMERSNCLIQLVDSRNPLFYISDDLNEYSTTTLNKPMMILLNKADYLSSKQRQVWYNYLINVKKYKYVVFFSALNEQSKLDLLAQEERKKQRLIYEQQQQRLLSLQKQQQSDALDNGDEDNDEENEDNDDDDSDEKKDLPESDKNDTINGKDNEVTETTTLEPNNDEPQTEPTKTVDDNNTNTTTTTTKNNDSFGIEKPLTREELIHCMLQFANENNCQPDPRYDNRIQFGMVGFPNVGKSSVINVLVGSSKHTHGLVRVAVASQPGKTKHFQTLLLPDCNNMMLCDCPGLVFPSFVSNTADLIAAGVYPIAQMRDHWPVIQLVCQRIPRPIIEALYGIQLPSPSIDMIQQQQHHQQMIGDSGNILLPPPTPEEFLGTLCVARGMLAASSGVPDYQRAARMVIKDYADGKLLYCHPPPNLLLLDSTTSSESSSSSGIEEFYNETIITAVHNTTKLQEKLLKQQLRNERTEKQHSNNKQRQDRQAHNQEESDCKNPSNDVVLIDDDILELLGSSTVQDTVISSNKQRRNTVNNTPDYENGKHGNKGRTPKSKWGKKDRKNRNNDPYGCHSTSADDVLLLEKEKSSSSASYGNSGGGIIMNAGKYTHSGYTRPTSYPSKMATTKTTTTTT